MNAHIISADSVTVIVHGMPYTITSDHSQYDALVTALRAGDVEAIERCVNTADKITKILGVFGAVEVFGGHVTFKGETIGGYLVEKIVEFATNGNPIEPLANFLNNVMENPSRRATEDLYAWCEAGRLPITPDGCIIAYKIVNQNYKDIHSGRFDNSVGATPRVNRKEVDDNPDVTCSHGLHFCSGAYLPHYGSSNGRVMLVKVHPRDVVAFPKDYNLSKARCCGYEVIEEIDRATAATFFNGKSFVYGANFTSCETDDDFDYAATIYDDDNADDYEDRIEGLEAWLGLSDGGDGTYTNRERLGVVLLSLGTTYDEDEDFEDNLDRAETLSGI
jgi:hypothetical protein